MPKGRSSRLASAVGGRAPSLGAGSPSGSVEGIAGPRYARRSLEKDRRRQLLACSASRDRAFARCDAGPTMAGGDMGVATLVFADRRKDGAYPVMDTSGTVVARIRPRRGGSTFDA